MRVVSSLVLLSFASAPLTAQPEGYYETAEGLEGPSLKAALHEIIDDHMRFPYTDDSIDVWNLLAETDPDPEVPGNVISIYANDSFLASAEADLWNREHTWPTSYGFPLDRVCNYPYSDVHHLRPANPNYNSSRGNTLYAFCTIGCEALPVTGAAFSNFRTGSGPDDGAFEVWSGRRGDAARGVLYMAVRYEGGFHQDGCPEPNLELTDDRGLIRVFEDNTGGTAYMGLLSDILRWHEQDPVDEREITRNEAIFARQGNRNPFIDRPEFAQLIWEQGVPAPTPSPTPDADSALPWINELHYDNISADENEGVEIAGPAGFSLNGWRVILYNGSDSETYGQIQLSGVIEEEIAGYGTIWFPEAPIQNGDPDGLALVDPDDLVIEFLSYEGVITALDGPAAGLTSTDIGVSESSSSSAMESLQRIGAGNRGNDFEWAGPRPFSQGALNSGQQITVEIFLESYLLY